MQQNSNKLILKLEKVVDDLDEKLAGILRLSYHRFNAIGTL